MKAARQIAVGVCLLLFFAISASAQSRLTVFISDIHLGLGRASDGQWHPYEDFRWPEALKSFLAAISKEGNDRVDLVIVGDFMELWQLPEDIRCRGTGADAGCSVPEMVELAGRIIRAHNADYAALSEFSVRGENRLHLVPGNHDAALLVPEVWALVANALGAGNGRVLFERSGIWRSADRRVLAEHGHQIGSDVNRFNNWPTVTTTGTSGERLMIRPWGERFVQQLFNQEEMTYPIIDNLSPESAGARYHMADRGISGSAVDIARFIAFNIFETSIDQKKAVLEVPPQPGAAPSPPPFVRSAALEAGPALFASSLDVDDPFRKLIEGTNADSRRLQTELTELAKTLSDEELQMLCQNAVLLEKKNLCAPTLSALATAALIPRQTVLRRHLEERRGVYGDFDVFVYAHTHQWERGWKLPLGDGSQVTIFNTGAFQRVVDEEGFLQRARGRPGEALRRLRPEDLAPCYGVVVIKSNASGIEAELRMWHMPELGAGRFREPGVSDCK